jgi:hypothetical protein
MFHETTICHSLVRPKRCRVQGAWHSPSSSSSSVRSHISRITGREEDVDFLPQQLITVTAPTALGRGREAKRVH